MEQITLSSEQNLAVDTCLDLQQRIVAVTGGAGTGKTTILKDGYHALREENYRVLLAAPTGRAAKRIEEATGIEARTIHRLLEFPAPLEVEESKGKIKFGEPKRNRWNPLPCDVLFIDEASMIASGLYSQVMEALPTHACIRFFGDANQLPPIDPEMRGESVFRKILRTRPAIYLTYNYRSNDNLIDSANRILRGSIPKRGDKFELVITDDPIGALREIVTPEYHTTDHQVLTPKRIGTTGAVRLSAIMRTKFNLHQGKPRITLERLRDDEDDITVLQDDKILWTKNDYVLNVMNGELGILDAIDDGTLSLILDDNRHIIVPPSVKGPFNFFYDPRKQIDLAYCMTTHKAQGSEFDSIIYVMARNQAFLLDRNNFYTGVTRARKKVIVITDRWALKYAMRPARSSF